MKDFKSLGLSEQTLATLERKGFKEPTEIQSLAIPLLMENELDIIAQAQTGTGKTAVFALPLIERLDPDEKGVQAIILAPTRELVIQVCEEIESLKGNSKIRTAAIYGGQQIDIQFKKLKKGVSIVVGTPGRILDHIRRRTLILDRIKYFILDEADEMLNMGFIEDIEEVLKETPEEKRVLLFSATMPKRIRKLAENYMGEYNHVKAEPQMTTDLTEQIYFEVKRKEKMDALSRILEIEHDFYGIIFCKTKADVDELNTRLIERGFKADNLHGDISQPLREKILKKFRTKKINVLVATDVAARGIDVEDLTHVINYSIPQNPEAYVHRIGRTGRAGKKGTAITFVTPSEFRKMNFIKKFTQAEIQKQKVPKREEIVDIRKKRVENDIEKMIKEKDTEGYRNWAKELLAESASEDLITALLKYSFGKDLEERGPMDYHRRDREPRERSFDDRGGRSEGSGKIQRDRSRRPGGNEKSYDGRRSEGRERPDRRRGRDDDRSGSGDQKDQRMTKLSIAMGKKEKMTNGKIVEIIKEKAGTPSHLIKEIEIHGENTVITVPAREAKSILKFFRRTKKGKELLITKVKGGGVRKRTGNKGGNKSRPRKEKGRYSRE